MITFSQTHQEKKEGTQINKISNEEVTMNTAEIQRIMKDYKQLYTNKIDNLEEINKFLEKYTLDQEETENLNRPVMSTEMETLTKS